MDDSRRPVRWGAVAPFFDGPDAVWLEQCVDPSKHEITLVPRPDRRSRDWHSRRSRVTGLDEWLAIRQHVDRVWRSDAEGIITVFPQLAAVAGLRKRLSRSDRPIVAWCLNIGKLYTGVRRQIARTALERIDCFVVHARRECDHYSSWYGLPRDRFEFVPFQQGYVEPTLKEDEEEPFIVSMGSAHRDYRTLFEAVRPLGIRTVVVAAPRCLEGLDVPDCVDFRTGLSAGECRELAERARLNVVPVENDETASGQRTVVEAMWLGRPVIATNCLGTEDYIDSGRDGFLVDLGQAGPLRDRIKDLWDNAELRARVGRAARERALARFSDAAAGSALESILDRWAR